MPFLTLSNSESQLAAYYNNTANGYFSGTPENPNVTKTQKPDIPELQYNNFDDGFIRGGITNAGLSAYRDLGRIGKFITGIDFDKNTSSNNSSGKLLNSAQGTLFLIKQAGLQLANPRLEWDRSNILPPLLGGPNRQFTGIGTLASVAGNAFGFHFDRGGLLGLIRADQKYGGDVDSPTSGFTYKNNFSNDGGNIYASENSRNRLVRYLANISDKKEPENPLNLDNSSQVKRFLNDYNSNSVVLDRYIGGPESIYGLGTTTIRTSPDSRTTIKTSDLGPQAFDAFKQGSRLGISDIAGGGGAVSINSFATSERSSFTAESTNPTLTNKLNGFIPLTNDVIISIPKVVDKTSKNIPASNVIANSPFYNKSSKVEKPGYTLEDTYGVTGGGNLDSINVINIVSSKIFYETNKGNKSNSSTEAISDNLKSSTDGDFGRDLIKFRLEFLNNEKAGYKSGTSVVPNTDVLAFRAYLDGFDDGMQAKWSAYRYMGRGEDFYVYEKFSRKINFSFVIFAHSKYEMPAIYTKLNYLMSAMAPDYNLYNQNMIYNI